MHVVMRSILLSQNGSVDMRSSTGLERCRHQITRAARDSLAWCLGPTKVSTTIKVLCRPPLRCQYLQGGCTRVPERVPQLSSGVFSEGLFFPFPYGCETSHQSFGDLSLRGWCFGTHICPFPPPHHCREIVLTSTVLGGVCVFL